MIEYEELQGLSPKSRGILYHLKTSLGKKKLSFQDHICNIFDYRKEKFNKKQFDKVIKKYDGNLLLNEIDDLFDQLDENKNGFVFFQSLENAIKSIDERDNPAEKLNRKSKILSGQEREEAQVMIEVKDLLLRTENYLEVIDLFDTDRHGYLKRQNVEELMNNFEYNNPGNRKKFLDIIFRDKKFVNINELLEKLDLDNNATRINLSDFQIHESILLEEEGEKMSLIKKKSSENKIKIEESFALEEIQNSQYYALENIPSILQPYFNYGSELEEPFATIAKEYISSQVIFFDGENPTYSKAHTWIHIAEYTNNNFFLFQKARSVIQRDKNRKGLGQMLEPKDIKQGSIGDCYFLSAVAAIVQNYPELVYRLFVLQKNPANIYGVRLFIDGAWKTFILDGCFPVHGNGALCGAQPHHKEIWVLLLEKAWAKAFKSYDNIIAGFNEEGLAAVSGAPTLIVSSRENGFLKKTEAHLKKGAIITCATSADVYQLNHHQQEKLGVFSGHAYTFLNAFIDIPYNNSVVTLIKIRNPWGKKGWKGDWSFNSHKWTKTLRNMVNYNVDPGDGTFFIELNDFIVYFDYINICQVNLANRNSWVAIHSNRYEFYETRFTIKTKGDYFFTLYQENPRKFKNIAAYQKSKSWLFLMKLEGGKIKAVASSAKSIHNNTIETTLEPGTYIIISRVNWKFWQEHSYNITSYGPDKIKFSQPIVADMNNLNDFIEKKSELGFGQVRMTYNGNASKRIYFSYEEGYGFICIVNHDNRVLDIQIRLDQLKGIWVLPPYNLPLQLTVFPYENLVCKFLVDPSGYHYHISEKPHFHN